LIRRHDKRGNLPVDNRNSGTAAFYSQLFLVFILGLLLRIQFSPDMNYETDSFVTLISAKSITDTGRYTAPPIRLTDHAGTYQSHPGWAVGYPLFLSIIFSFVGYGEDTARFATIILCSSVVPIVGVAGRRFGGGSTGLIAALLVAVNPLLVCLNGRILTANLGYCLLSISLSFLFLATLREREDEAYLSFEELIGCPKRLLYASTSFLFFGLTLATRDDFAMFGLPFLVVLLGMFRASSGKGARISLSDSAKLAGFCGVPLIAGLVPNLYFNYMTYGKVLTSSHYEYGGRLNLAYLWEGARGALSLPGWVVIVLTILVFAFPIVSILAIRKLTEKASLMATIILALALPIILINGAYPVTSSGASPRYVLPLIPFVSIMVAALFAGEKTISRKYRCAFIAALSLWHVLLYYPPPFLFTAFPKTAYLTQYSPWYNKNNFINYPHPIRASVQWVKMHTPPDAIILSDYDSYNYYFYTGRDVMNKEMIGEIARQLESRPIYYIDDHQSVLYDDSLTEWRASLKENRIVFDNVDSIRLFSPARGEVRLRVFALSKVKAS